MLFRSLLAVGVLLSTCISFLKTQSDDNFFVDVASASVPEAGTTSIQLTAATFDSLVSVQFSVNWDTSVVTYTGFSIVDLPTISVGITAVEEGQLRISWFSPDGMPQTEMDELGLVSIQFQAVGPVGSSTEVDITDDPLARQVFRGLPQAGNFYEIDFLHQSGIVTIEDPTQLNVQFSPQPVSCFGGMDGSIEFTTNADPQDFTFNWIGPDGSALTPPLSELAAGLYQLMVLDQDGMTVFTGQTIITQPAEAISLNVDSLTPANCSTDGNIQLSAFGGTSPYVFSTNDNSNVDGTFSDIPFGNYSATVTDANGCTDSTGFTIEQISFPNLEFGATIRSLCGVDSVRLGPSGELGELSFNWSTGSTDSEISVTIAGEYGLTVTGQGGCIGLANYVVTAGPGGVDPILLTEATGICPGDSLLLEVSGGTNFNWINGASFLDRQNGNVVIASPPESFEFLVEVTDGCNTQDTMTVTVEVFQILASAGPDTCVALGLPLQLSASGGVFYEWMASEYPVSNPMLGNPTVAPEETTTYQVLIEDINGCLTEDEVTVEIAPDPVGTILPVNIITPNGDRANDVLEFDGIEKFGSNSLRIYNRSGRLVYNKLNYQSDSERFTGDYLDAPLPAGTYFYVLKFRDGTIKQSLAILR
ncbi:hypothetical protein CEQ90_09465 [Lewinellaceae bacterium SD302]|nr:hypothetical protein CEQ90_09465 [Lewinellaceae bacterium SD302]